MTVTWRPNASLARDEAILSGGRTVVDDNAVIFVSAETEVSRSGGGCLPLSNEEELDSVFSSLLELAVRFRLLRDSGEVAVGLDFFEALG